jgi:hypothetical protein
MRSGKQGSRIVVRYWTFFLSARRDYYVDILSCFNVFDTHVFFSDLHLSLNYKIPVEGGMRKETLGLKGKICVAGEM